ncbi:MAG: hypothetical protein EOP38_19625 [Rubrivivax sp.]|nr:MAG: hypothetical protein EOP38_19625 [Rubrivivax sp.]
MSDRNLYAPPTAAVRDVSSMGDQPGDESFNPEGRSLPAGAGWRWYGDAWRVFKVRPLAWWGVLLVVFGVLAVASVIPLLNLVSSLLFPVMVAGMGVCVRSQLRTGGFEIRQVFAGFGPRRNALLQAGALYMLITVLSMAIFALLSGASLTALYLGSMAERQVAMRAVFEGSALMGLLYFAVLSVAMSAILFAPYLIQEQNIAAPQAMLMSLKASFKNIPASLVWLLSYFLWALVATIPLGLGWLILVPVLCLTAYLAYREIFYN